MLCISGCNVTHTAVINTILTIPTQRKIRAFNKGENCNAAKFCGYGGRKFRQFQLAAEPQDQLAQAGIIRACNRGACTQISDFGENTVDFRLFGAQNILTRWVLAMKDQATKRAGETVQGENRRVLLKESPHLCFFPAPAFAQLFQRQYSVVRIQLNGGGQKRKCVAWIIPGGMAPQIQQRICFFKAIIQMDKPLGDASGDAHKTVTGCGVHCPGFAFLAGATYYPVRNPILQAFGLGIQRVGEVAQLLQLVHDLQGQHTASYTKNAFQPDHAARPHAGCDLVFVSAVEGCAFPECCPGSKFGPITQYPLALGQLVSGQFNPLVFEQTLHGRTPPDCFVEEKMKSQSRHAEPAWVRKY